MGLFFIAASDLDMIIGIIAVVGWIIAQLFGKKKTEGSPQEPSAPDAPPSLDPRDELRKFFDELEKANKPAESSRPTAMPPPLQQAPPREKPVRRVHVHEPRVESFSPSPRPDYTALATPLTFQVAHETAPSSRAAVVERIQSPAMPELRQPGALRKFIMANEVLGKPVALR